MSIMGPCMFAHGQTAGAHLETIQSINSVYGMCCFSQSGLQEIKIMKFKWLRCWKQRTEQMEHESTRVLPLQRPSVASFSLWEWTIDIVLLQNLAFP